MKRKPPALRNIGLDLDSEAVAAFRCDYPVELHQCCAHRFLSEFPFLGRELVYCDPPYLHQTRRSARRYRYEYDEAAHEELLALVRRLCCQVMISGYRSPLYDERLADWRKVEIQVNNQAAVVTEVVWYNFEPDRVHWAKYAGRNFTHRQSIKRKAENWGNRYAALPRSERLAVLSSIMAVEAESWPV